MEEIKKQTEINNPTYEDLQSENAFLKTRLQEAYARIEADSAQSYFIRLDYLFKILENKEVFVGEVIDAAIAEISTALGLIKVEEDVK